MGEFKGTPGPWRVGNHDSCVVSGTNTNLTIRGAYEEDAKGYYGGYLIGESISKYNALLISKAPDLLEVLKKAKSQIAVLKRSMLVHPDCVSGSEFDDYTTSAQETEDEIERLIKEATELDG